MGRRLGFAAFAVLTLGFPVVARGQTQAPAPGPTFEVAAVKVNNGNDNRVMLGLQPGGRFTATNVPLRMLIRVAYRLQEAQIVGGPEWLSTTRFDITAKAEADVSQEQVQMMVRTLLAERFGLVTHHETRELPIYALIPAREDGKLGPKIKPAAVDCAQVGRGRGATPQPPPQPGSPMPCGLRMGPGSVIAGGMKIAELANALSPIVSRNVVDRTNLAGNYDFELTWTPEQRPAGSPQGGAPSPVPSVDASGASIFTAIQEQLGLKLDAQRSPTEVLVIDKVSQPTVD